MRSLYMVNECDPVLDTHSTKPSQGFESGNSTRCLLQQHYEDSHSYMDGKHMILMGCTFCWQCFVCVLLTTGSVWPYKSILKQLCMYACTICFLKHVIVCNTFLFNELHKMSLFYTWLHIVVTVSDMCHIANAYKPNRVLHRNHICNALQFETVLHLYK